MASPHRPLRHRLLAGAGVGAVLLTASAAVVPGVSNASSHREAPLIAGDPRADNTDVYAFVSPDRPSTVTLIANWIPFEEPNGGPNFYPFATHAAYRINIDNNGDGRPDVVYTWKFTNHYRNQSGAFLYNTGVVNHLTDSTLNFYQTYNLLERKNGTTVRKLHNKMVAPSDVGKASMPNYAQLRKEAIAQGRYGHSQTYVGQADDPFFLDLRVFDLLYGGNLSETGQDSLDGYNVNTIALQVPKSEIALKGSVSRNPVVGVWSTTSRQATTSYSSSGAKYKGSYVQVSRLGNPLVNEVVVPLKYKDAFNGLQPFQDHTVTPVVNKVLDPMVPHLIQAIYGIPAPPTPRNDLAEIFLTGICKACGPIQADLNSQRLNKDVSASKFVPAEELRLNLAVKPTAKPNRLGVIGGDLQGFPNGRRLTDDVVDIALQAMEGAAQSGQIVAPLAKGDKVNANDVRFGTSFPYVGLPAAVGVNTEVNSSPKSGAAFAAPTGGTNTGGGFGSGHLVPLTAGLGAAAFAAAAFALASARRRRLIVA
jgi:hypothetical protein